MPRTGGLERHAIASRSELESGLRCPTLTMPCKLKRDAQRMSRRGRCKVYRTEGNVTRCAWIVPTRHGLAHRLLQPLMEGRIGTWSN